MNFFGYTGKRPKEGRGVQVLQIPFYNFLKGMVFLVPDGFFVPQNAWWFLFSIQILIQVPMAFQY